MTDSDNEAEVMVVKPRPKPIPCKQVATPVPASEVKVKKELKAVANVKGDSPISVTSNSNVTPTASLDNSLPQFARAIWNTDFLPTLYKYLGLLEKPWELSDPKETDDLKTIQMLVDIVYLRSNYKVTINDRIYIMVRELSHSIWITNVLTTLSTGEGPD